MGQHHSSEEKKAVATKPAGASGDREAEKEKARSSAAGHRSVHPSHSVRGRATPVRATTSAESATAQTTTPIHLDPSSLQKTLDSSPSDTSARRQRAHSPTRSQSQRDTPTAADASAAAITSPSGPVNVPSRPLRGKTASSAEQIYNGKPSPKFVNHNSEPDQEASSDGQDIDNEALLDQDDELRRYVPPAEHRPPRLPLPIVDPGPVPDSPTLPPIDKADKGGIDLEFLASSDGLSDTDPPLVRRSSMLSAGSQDEDDIGEELPPVDPTAETVPTTIEWNKPGNRVYVTGTFANWEKKYRMQRKKDDSGFRAVINLPAGTHHVMFIVDDKMTTNGDMATAVDFNNFLVNYIEISTEDVEKSRDESQPDPGQHKDSTTTGKALQDGAHEEHTHDEASHANEAAENIVEEVLPGDFRQIVPQSLIDMDLPEDDPRYHNAARVIQDMPAPPGLPMFLNKSLLNGYTPVKDDNSVLGLPNHTVLNHLMTSSVKNGVLATSVTTRYKKKYVTTISFKPVPKQRTKSTSTSA
ncbi:hypothetical protein DV735_g659, partial [Chaetothyriales sp. CBS 134920]